MEENSQNYNINNEKCNMCLNIFDKYISFTCNHKICLNCFYKILLRSFLQHIALNKEINIICVCNKGKITKDLNSLYKDLNELYENNFNINSKNEKNEKICGIHSNQLITDFCLDCLEYICKHCTEKNNYHHLHNIQSINEYSQIVKEKMKNFPNISNLLIDYEEKINNYYEEYLNDISFKIDYLINEIKKYKNHVLESIKNKIKEKILPMKICLLLYKYYDYEIEKSSNNIYRLLFLLNTKITIPEFIYQKNKTENDIENIIKSVNNLNLDKRIIFTLNNKFSNYQNFQNFENSHNSEINYLVKITENKFVTGDFEGYIKIWKFSGKGIFNLQSEKAHKSKINSIIGLNKKKFASCSLSEDFILIWKENYNNNHYNIFQKINLDNQTCLALNKLNDNKTLIAGLDDNKIYTFCKNEKKEYLKNKNIGFHEGKINHIIQLKNQLIVSCSNDKDIIIWRENNKEEILKGHLDSINIIIELDNENICSGSSDKNIIIWKKNSDLKKYESYFILKGHLDSIISLCYLNDKRIISGSVDSTIKIWLLSRDNYICSFTIFEHNLNVSGLISINDYVFISSSYDKSIKVWIENNN